MKFRETVRKVNKPDEFYWCDLLHREPGYVVLGYHVTRDRQVGPFAIPAGSMTVAHYRENTGHVLWEMVGPDGTLLGYLYHLCLPPEIGENYVEYLDLLLDIWFDPEGEMTVLDEDELEQAVEQGKIGRDQRRFIECQRETVTEGHPRVLADLWRPPEGILPGRDRAGRGNEPS